MKIAGSEWKFPVKTFHGKIDGRNPRRQALDAYVGLFAREFRLYPKSLVKRAKLKQIVLCEQLAFAGQRRNAIPDFEHDTLYLEVSRGSYSKPYMRRVIHHEFFHIVDYRDDGHVYRDKRWAQLNPAKFKYGKGGTSAFGNPYTSVLTEKYPGFLDHYATTGVEEDKAEMFANMMVNPGYVSRRIETDRVIKAKAERMKELLVKFCPDVDAEFWNKVRKARHLPPVP